MKIAHVLIPDFPIQVEVLADPSLERKPIVIGGRPDDEGEVFARSPAAQRDGVEVGISLRQAEQLCPQAVFLPVDEAKYRQAHKGLITCLSAFSPLRETVSPGEVCLEASGLEGLYGSDPQLAERLCSTIQAETGLQPQVGLAAERFTAATAARIAPLGAGLVVPARTQGAFLAPLPLDALPISQEAHRLLTRLGVVTLGQVAAMPPGSLSRALGYEGEKIHRLARGEDERRLIPEFEETPLSAQVTLDFRLEYLPALVAYADLLVTQLAGELLSSGLAAGNIILEVEQEDGALLTAWGFLRPASSDRGRLTDRAAGLLERMSYTAGASGLKVALTPLLPAHEGSRQLPFQQRYALTPDPVGKAVRTIRDRYGGAAIQAAARISGPPPVPVEVRTTGEGAPSAMVRDRTWSRIDSIQLHWRLEGEWWFQEGRKDYYQVVTKRGEILVLLHTSPEDRWYLHPAAKPSQWPAI